VGNVAVAVVPIPSKFCEIDGEIFIFGPFGPTSSTISAPFGGVGAGNGAVIPRNSLARSKKAKRRSDDPAAVAASNNALMMAVITRLAITI
jgi:hypothetical protein